MSLSPSWHAQHHSGDTIDRISRSSEALSQYATYTFFTIEAIIRLISAYIIMALFNIHALYIVSIITLLAAINVTQFDKRLSKKYSKLNEYENTISAKIFDAISNITTVIILKIEKLLSKGIKDAIKKPYKTFDQAGKLTEIKWFLVDFLVNLMLFMIIASYILTNVNSTILIGTLAALVAYVQRIAMVFFNFTFRYSEIVRQDTTIKNAQAITKEFTNVQQTKQVSMNTWKQLTTKNLSFSYHGLEGDLHLNNISFNFKKGEKIALVGESGSGKTTFLKLLRGLYEPQSATIHLDKKELKTFKEISDAITLIPQDPELFATTVGENITLGTDVSQDQIDKVTKDATFNKVVPRLPNGYDSLIQEKGVNLSGGEKQRLALARGLLFSNDKQIMLLDEPTSSVDAKNEREFFNTVFKEKNATTIIASVHRLNLLPLFDRIFYFQNGNIVAKGTLKELQKTSKEFKSIYKKYS